MIKSYNPSLHPIAARWAAPGELFVGHLERSGDVCRDIQKLIVV